MSSKTSVTACLLIIILLTAGVASMAIGDGSDSADGGARSSGDRETAIDGYFLDEFDNPLNMTLYGDAATMDNALTLSRVIWADTFDRFPLTPWTAAEGNPRITQQVLLTNATDTTNSTARRSINMHDMQILFDFSPGLTFGSGPVVSLKEGSVDHVWFAYRSQTQRIEIGMANATVNGVLKDMDVNIMQDDWYKASILISDTFVEFRVGQAGVSTNIDQMGDFKALEFTAPPMESAAWDNVTVNKLGATGWAVSNPVDLPVDTYWDLLKVNPSRPSGTTMEISLINGSDDFALPGLEEVTRTITSLSTKTDPAYLNPTVITSVKIKVTMTATGTSVPNLWSWKISWLGDPPRFIQAIDDVVLNEDEDLENVVDLRNHFVDRFTASEDLVYTVSYTSEPQHVLPWTDGYNLSFSLPTDDWYGVEQYKVTASDGMLSIESLLCKVTVRAVDDPPVIKLPTRIEVIEDTPYVFNITPYMEDKDTPLEVIRVRTQAYHASVDGQFITFFYDEGGIDERIELEITDLNNVVTVELNVRVIEVDDPPELKPINNVMMDEDQKRSIKILNLMSDEDTLIEDLVITVLDGDEHITVDNANQTLLLFYPVENGEFEYTIKISDGTSSATQPLIVNVIPMNDMPAIRTVGDIEPVDGELSVSLIEGETLSLFIVVEDEESTTFQFTLVTSWDGAIVRNTTLDLESKIGEQGKYDVQVLVSDGSGSAFVTVHVDVMNRNDPPRDAAITAPLNNTNHDNGTLIAMTAYAIDPDIIYGDVLEFNWSSDVQGPLGTGRTIEVSDLKVGVHIITMAVTDGDYTVEEWIKITIKAVGGGGNNGGGGGGGGGDDDSTGLTFGIIIAVIVAVAVVGAFLFMRTQRTAQKTVVVPTGYSLDGPDPTAAPEAAEKPADEPADVATEPLEPVGLLPELEPSAPVDTVEPGAAEPASGELVVPDVSAPAEAAAEPEAPTPDRVAAPERVGTISSKSFLLDKPVVTEEEKALDELKRLYQNTIGILPFGVPAPELASWDWVEIAVAMANGEKKTLPDGREITKVDGRWYYSDTEDTKSFLKEHQE